MKLTTLMGLCASTLLVAGAVNADVNTLRAALNAGVGQLMADTSRAAAQAKMNAVDLVIGLAPDAAAASAGVVIGKAPDQVKYTYTATQLANVPAIAAGDSKPQQMAKWGAMAVDTLAKADANGLSKTANGMVLKLLNGMATVVFTNAAGASKRYMCHHMGDMDMCM